MNKATLQPDGSWKVETMTDAEVTDWKETQESGKTLKTNMEAAIAKKATDKASATTKLKALGLTDDEIAALSS
tara:strand:+ start:800 stop:1018 length:219 start_codon:yes stop_codon:yes gene_type:complete